MDVNSLNALVEELNDSVPLAREASDFEPLCHKALQQIVSSKLITEDEAGVVAFIKRVRNFCQALLMMLQRLALQQMDDEPSSSQWPTGVKFREMRANFGLKAVPMTNNAFYSAVSVTLLNDPQFSSILRFAALVKFVQFYPYFFSYWTQNERLSGVHNMFYMMLSLASFDESFTRQYYAVDKKEGFSRAQDYACMAVALALNRKIFVFQSTLEKSKKCIPCRSLAGLEHPTVGVLFIKNKLYGMLRRAQSHNSIRLAEPKISVCLLDAENIEILPQEGSTSGDPWNLASLLGTSSELSSSGSSSATQPTLINEDRANVQCGIEPELGPAVLTSGSSSATQVDVAEEDQESVTDETDQPIAVINEAPDDDDRELFPTEEDPTKHRILAVVAWVELLERDPRLQTGYKWLPMPNNRNLLVQEDGPALFKTERSLEPGVYFKVIYDSELLTERPTTILEAENAGNAYWLHESVLTPEFAEQMEAMIVHFYADRHYRNTRDNKPLQTLILRDMIEEIGTEGGLSSKAVQEGPHQFSVSIESLLIQFPSLSSGRFYLVLQDVRAGFEEKGLIRRSGRMDASNQLKLLKDLFYRWSHLTPSNYKMYGSLVGLNQYVLVPTKKRNYAQQIANSNPEHVSAFHVNTAVRDLKALTSNGAALALMGHMTNWPQKSETTFHAVLLIVGQRRGSDLSRPGARELRLFDPQGLSYVLPEPILQVKKAFDLGTNNRIGIAHGDQHGSRDCMFRALSIMAMLLDGLDISALTFHEEQRRPR